MIPLLVALALAGCGSSTTPASEPAESPRAQQEEARLHRGGEEREQNEGAARCYKKMQAGEPC